MKKKKVDLIIEASATGFGIFGEDFPFTSYGDTINAAKADMEEILKTMLAFYKEEGKPVPASINNGHLEFVYHYDIASIFKHFGVLDASAFAKRIGMNASLLRQYKTGKTLASSKQKEKIEKGLHELGKELLALRL
jgi:predicted RNase H-like HicB family nuclease